MNEKYCMYCMNPIKDTSSVCSYCNHEKSDETYPHQLLPGTLLNGKYLIGNALGEGGFGITYIGRDINLDMRIAIKEYYPNGLTNRNHTHSQDIAITTKDKIELFEKGKKRFLDEARILAKFSGEKGIVNVRDFFQANNTAYIVMEYLEGITLRDFLKKNGTMNIDTVLSMMNPLMNSLELIHSCGMIHRDISPDNIMIVRDQQLKLLDFGAARNISGTDPKSLSVMLKPGYAPEEQYRSKGMQGPWTDVYALSATIYKCITGITPDDSMQRVFNDEVKKPSELNVSIKSVQENALMRGMSIKQTDRLQNIAEMRAALDAKEFVTVDDSKTVFVDIISNETMTSENTMGAQDNKTLDISHTQNPLQQPQSPIQAPVQAPLQPQHPVQAPVQASFQQQQAPIQAPVQAPIQQQQPPEPLNATPAYAPQVNAPTNYFEANSNSTNVASSIATKTNKNIIIRFAIIGVVGIAITLACVIGYSQLNNKSNDSKDAPAALSPAASLAPTTPEVTEAVTPTYGVELTGSVEPNDVPVSMSDDLYDFTVKLEGVVYKLPCKVDYLLTNGWVPEDDLDVSINPNDTEPIYFSNGDKECMVTIANMSQENRKLSNCTVCGIAVDSFLDNKDVQIEIAKNIKKSVSSKDDVIAAYGKPSDTYEGDSYETLIYSNGDYNEITISIDVAGNQKVDGIDIRNLVAIESDQATVNNDKSQKELDYKAPSALGSDPTSFNYECQGDIYHLPTPISAFINNGWTVTSKSTDTVAAHDISYSALDLMKDNQTITVDVFNYSDFVVPTENCFATSIECDSYSNLDLVLPGGIKVGSKKGDVLKAFGDMLKNDSEPSTLSFYEYEVTYSKYINIAFDEETKSVYSIEMYNEEDE